MFSLWYKHSDCLKCYLHNLHFYTSCTTYILQSTAFDNRFSPAMRKRQPKAMNFAALTNNMLRLRLRGVNFPCIFLLACISFLRKFGATAAKSLTVGIVRRRFFEKDGGRGPNLKSLSLTASGSERLREIKRSPPLGPHPL